MKNQNFPDKIKIVLKKKYREDGHQGFIALDEKSLETGITWAGGYYNSVKDPYEIVDYENGKFTLKISRAAESSYSQGKLSFWTLVVTAPDGRSFDVGINSESLIATILTSTVTNGEIDGMFYLGRTQGQQSIAKEDSEYYKEYLESVETKKTPLTKKYNRGDVIVNNLQKYVYIGSFTKSIKADIKTDYRSSKDTKLVIREEKPFEVHGYIYIEDMDNPLSEKITFYTEPVKKGGRVIGKVNEENINIGIKSRIDFILSRFDELNKNAQDKYSHYFWSIDSYLEEYFCINGIIDINKALEEIKKIGLVLSVDIQY